MGDTCDKCGDELDTPIMCEIKMIAQEYQLCKTCAIALENWVSSDL